jgi:cytochrome c-type biogenesis protein CcmH/NrfG
MPETAVQLGRVYAQRGQYQKSSEAYAKALSGMNN